jgi:hypothetical protein
MAPRPDAAALNVQPRQRRIVYEDLAKVPAGRSVKDLLGEVDIPERDLRETLRKLDAAGLAQRIKGVWRAVPLEDANGDAAAAPAEEADAEAETGSTTA